MYSEIGNAIARLSQSKVFQQPDRQLYNFAVCFQNSEAAANQSVAFPLSLLFSGWCQYVIAVVFVILAVDALAFAL